MSQELTYMRNQSESTQLLLQSPDREFEKQQFVSYKQ